MARPLEVNFVKKQRMRRHFRLVDLVAPAVLTVAVLLQAQRHERRDAMSTRFSAEASPLPQPPSAQNYDARPSSLPAPPPPSPKSKGGKGGGSSKKPPAKKKKETRSNAGGRRWRTPAAG